MKKINFTATKFLFSKRCRCIRKLLVSEKIYVDRRHGKYGYLDNDDIVKPLNIMFPKASAHVKKQDGQTKWIYLMIQNKDLVEKYNTICNKVSADIKKEFDREPVYNK